MQGHAEKKEKWKEKGLLKAMVAPSGQVDQVGGRSWKQREDYFKVF
jgi:hypothetical protein